jgi:hypothetical protein
MVHLAGESGTYAEASVSFYLRPAKRSHNKGMFEGEA